ncbi:MAG: hypothetical protein RR585_06075 [Coprobacillus sp.]
MTKDNLKQYKTAIQSNQFYTDLFSKPIWGDMGEDSASIYLSVVDDSWHLHFIRTQSGEPYPLSETVCNIIDEYEKDLTDDEVYDFLMLHKKTKEFEDFLNTKINSHE